jgi:lipopolysaccharide transport system ATP-binding protein
VIAVECERVAKRYRAPGSARPGTLKERILRGRGDAEWFWALQGVDVEVRAGRTLGIVGANGAGKSTLLRLICGVGRPDSGRVSVHGRVSALLDLEAGFHPELTGRENGQLVLVASGVRRSGAGRRVELAAEFAGVERFLDAPVRTYSSGMRARLGLALALDADADVLVIDEALSVGDAAFRQRCVETLSKRQGDGASAVMVSHDLQLVDELCNDAVWLREGRIASRGTPAEVVTRYVNALAESAVDVPPGQDGGRGTLRLGETRFGSQEATITAVELCDPTGAAVTKLAPGSGIVVRMSLDAALDEPVHAVVALRRDDDVLCVDVNALFDPPLPREVRVEIPRLDLGGGRYFVDVGLYDAAWERTLDLHWHVYTVVVHGSAGTTHRPVVVPPAVWTAER